MITPPKDELLPSVPLPPMRYLVESVGEILRVSMKFESLASIEKTAFCIYKLALDHERNNSLLFWVKVSDIGDQMLFLDAQNGFSMNATSFHGCKGNCIYFLHLHCTPCRYNIEDGKTERFIKCPFQSSTWFVPDLRVR